jgi:hypothetical protein
VAKRAGTDGVHGSRLQIHQDCTGNVAATGGFVVVNVDALELEIGVAMVGSGGVELVTGHLPKLGTDPDRQRDETERQQLVEHRLE